jgi:hypothetical protein
MGRAAVAGMKVKIVKKTMNFLIALKEVKFLNRISVLMILKSEMNRKKLKISKIFTNYFQKWNLQSLNINITN